MATDEHRERQGGGKPLQANGLLVNLCLSVAALIPGVQEMGCTHGEMNFSFPLSSFLLSW
jgi:hypothetical protein